MVSAAMTAASICDAAWFSKTGLSIFFCEREMAPSCQTVDEIIPSRSVLRYSVLPGEAPAQPANNPVSIPVSLFPGVRHPEPMACLAFLSHQNAPHKGLLAVCLSDDCVAEPPVGPRQGGRIEWWDL